jgi:hypothetical protein
MDFGPPIRGITDRALRLGDWWLDVGRKRYA